MANCKVFSKSLHSAGYTRATIPLITAKARRLFRLSETPEGPSQTLLYSMGMVQNQVLTKMLEVKVSHKQFSLSSLSSEYFLYAVLC